VRRPDHRTDLEVGAAVRLDVLEAFRERGPLDTEVVGDDDLAERADHVGTQAVAVEAVRVADAVLDGVRLAGTTGDPSPLALVGVDPDSH
jgi:hypothetical protein